MTDSPDFAAAVERAARGMLPHVFDEAFNAAPRVNNWRETARQKATAALLAAGWPPPSVPLGWKLVPVEPTEKMLRAGNMTGFRANWGTVSRDVYCAMVAAAPHPPSSHESIAAGEEP